jgi:hypothetical protein
VLKVDVSDSSKYRLFARRSGTAGIVICISWAIALLTHFASVSNPVSVYSMRFAHCLLVVLPIPAVVIGLWSIRSLDRKEHGQDIGHAVFGILSGILSIVAILFLMKYSAGSPG